MADGGPPQDTRWLAVCVIVTLTARPDTPGADVGVLQETLVQWHAHRQEILRRIDYLETRGRMPEDRVNEYGPKRD